jgi:hypothetical protein
VHISREVVVGFFGFGDYHTARSIWRIVQIRVSRKFLCTVHAAQGTFCYSGLKEALVGGKAGRVFEMPGMQLSFSAVPCSEVSQLLKI